MSEIGKSIGTESGLVAARTRERGKQRVNRYRVSVWDDEKVLKIFCTTT